MTPPNHKHNPVTDASGRVICSTCNQLIINSIKSSDDPRLQDAGFDRGSRSDVELTMPPLPVVLLTLYFNGPALGLAKAPVSWYVDNLAQAIGNASQGTINPDDIWDDLYRKWHNVSRGTHTSS